MKIKNIAHPEQIIDKKLVEILRNYSADAEQIKKLHPEQLAIIYEQKWFKLFVAKKYGGLALSIPEALKIEEALAWIDGSLGWTVTLCSGANWFMGFIQKEIADGIFFDKEVCLAGSGKVSGVAKIINGGFEITGYWPYATGSAHATAFTANCMIEKDGVILKDENNNPVISAFLLLKNEVIVHKRWDYIGMTATSSNSFAVKQLKVTADRLFVIDKEHCIIQEPIYQYPFIPFAEVTLAVNSAGMALRFIDLYKKGQKGSTRKINAKVLAYHDELKELFNKTREDFYEAVDNSWEAHLQKQNAMAEKTQIVGAASRALAAAARRLVDELYPYCTLAAAIPDSEINRVWRNIHTASQHPLLLSYDRPIID
jgi:indole-3-acetate monooxygenase